LDGLVLIIFLWPLPDIHLDGRSGYLFVLRNFAETEVAHQFPPEKCWFAEGFNLEKLPGKQIPHYFESILFPHSLLWLHALSGVFSTNLG
jgi:hypothetical protein